MVRRCLSSGSWRSGIDADRDRAGDCRLLASFLMKSCRVPRTLFARWIPWASGLLSGHPPSPLPLRSAVAPNCCLHLRIPMFGNRLHPSRSNSVPASAPIRHVYFQRSLILSIDDSFSPSWAANIPTLAHGCSRLLARVSLAATMTPPRAIREERLPEECGKPSHHDEGFLLLALPDLLVSWARLYHVLESPEI